MLLKVVNKLWQDNWSRKIVSKNQFYNINFIYIKLLLAASRRRSSLLLPTSFCIPYGEAFAYFSDAIA